MSNVRPVDFLDSLLGAFKTYWDTTRPAVPLAWPNRPLDPAAEFPSASSSDAWVEIQVIGDPEGRTPIASSANVLGSNQLAGTVAFAIYVRENTGTRLALQLADDIVLFLESTRDVSETVFRDIAPHQEVGSDGAWFQVNVTASYVYFTDRG